LLLILCWVLIELLL